VSTHRKGRVCFLSRWEIEESRRGIKPNCRNHRHISRAEAFDLSGDPYYGTILDWIWLEGSVPAKLGCRVYFVKVAGRIEFTIANSGLELPFDQVRAKGLELEKKLGIPFIERKVPLHIRQ
jgi:hypothetical protein